MDTMDYTKIVGGLCGALLVLLLVSWAGETIYHVGDAGHGGDEAHASGFVIEVAEVVEENAEDGPSIMELLASADVAKGERVFKKCATCHTLEPGANKNGPTLYQVIDRDIASVDGFDYTGSLTGLEGDWTIEELSAFLSAPKKYAPGTKMAIAVKKISDRANLIAYLQSLN